MPVQNWHAKWISTPGASPHGYGVYHFRRSFDIANTPAHFIIHASGDNRYLLFVNGQRVSVGPAREDLFHWRYETVDIAAQLHVGVNVIAATVWNWGDLGPLNQITAQTGFLLQGDGPAEEVVNTNKSWRTEQDQAYSELPVMPSSIGYQYYVAPPGEQFDGRKHEWNWTAGSFNDAAWLPAQEDNAACSADWIKDNVPGDCHDPHLLVPRSIPVMAERAIPFRRVRINENATVEGTRYSVGAHTHARLLLDAGEVTTGYLHLITTGGAAATISLRYAESLWIPHNNEKGNRDEVEGKEMRGVTDRFVADGATSRSYRPLWWRSFRYVELTVDTQSEPLTIAEASVAFSAYPFEHRASFISDGPAWLPRVLEVGYHTNVLSSHETYLDAYFEQLQYVADTRIESLVSLYENGDPLLMRNAIEQIDSSRTPEGLTMSRAPSRLYQYTPTFSLLWIEMLHDYWRYVDDPEFVRSMLPGVRAVLGWFRNRQSADGSLTSLPYYNFLDSDVPWNAHALGPYECQLLAALRDAALLEQALGSAASAESDRTNAERLQKTIRSRYWDAAKQLFSDDPAHIVFTQHMNALAVLTDVVVGTQAKALMERTIASANLLPCTIYFRYYLNRAMVHAGLGDRYLEMLGPWRDLLALNVTAWPEVETAKSRSDCHGWGDHPNIEIYRTVPGVDSAAPGFRRVAIEPHLGQLHNAEGTVPLPAGAVHVKLERTNGGGIAALVDTPVPGDFFWHAKTIPLHEGRNELHIQR